MIEFHAQDLIIEFLPMCNLRRKGSVFLRGVFVYFVKNRT